jgi:hypothetical protein
MTFDIFLLVDLKELFSTSLLVVVCFPDLRFLVIVACTLLFSRKILDIEKLMGLSLHQVFAKLQGRKLSKKFTPC